MKANELRIGNFVFDDENKPMKVARVETQECTDFNGNDEFNVIIEHIDKNIGYYESKINPIPLTEEWLKKFWLLNNAPVSSREYTLFFKGSNILMVNHYENGWLIKCDWWSVGILIKYVHQFQNLYYAITQEELIYTP